MGLDNIVYKQVAVEDKRLAEALAPLCGGMLTDGANSFRGKVYSDLVEAITDHDLYSTDEWTWSTMDQVVKSFEDIILEDKVQSWLDDYNSSKENVWNIKYSKEEFMALYKVFKLCSDEGWSINAWY